MLTPAFLRTDGRSTEYYRTHPEARAKKAAYQATRNKDPKQVAYRVELKRERRRRGIYGKGGPDVSHTESGRLVLESPSTNRARNGHGGKPRLRADTMPTTLTAGRFTRLDLKCGRGAISKGEKCHVGAATAAKEKEKGTANKRSFEDATGLTKTEATVLGVLAVATTANIIAGRNQKKAYAEKFKTGENFKRFTDTIGDPDKVLKGLKVDGKMGAPSLFGSVQFGDYNGQKVVVKRPAEATLMGDLIFSQYEVAGIISNKAAVNLKDSLKNITDGEVRVGEIAGNLGFGPKLVAAKPNIIISEVAQGRPLSSQDFMSRAFKPTDVVEKPMKVIETMRRGLFRQDITPNHKQKILANMATMHSAGIAHNDLHPGNIFISKKGAQFIDYGLAEKGGGAVAAEFVRMMNKPSFGLQEKAGMGYNLKTLDLKNYTSTERELRQLVDKRVGRLSSMDIRKAVERNPDIEDKLQSAIDKYYDRLVGSRTDSAPEAVVTTSRIDKKCGKGAISAHERCTKPTSTGMSRKKRAAIVGALTVTAVAAGITAAALHGRPRSGARTRSPGGPMMLPPSDRLSAGKLLALHQGPRPRTAPGPLVPTRPQARVASGTTPKLPGFSPHGLLPPAKRPLSKTQRMQANTQAAEAIARERIAQTAREEARRVAQIGNTMAAAGEAAGMRTKLTARNLRLRAEAARRRWEPGYRSPDKPRPQRMLAEGGEQPLQFPMNASQPLTPQRLELDPRTGQPKRRRARGFGSQEG